MKIKNEIYLYTMSAKVSKMSSKSVKVASVNAESSTSKKRKHRYKPGTVVLREIKKQQKNTNNIIPSTPFKRLVREVAQDHGEFLFEAKAFDALQESAETFLIDVFRDTNKLAIHRGCQTVEPRDMKLALALRRDKVMH